MALENYVEPEVAIAVALTVAVASPPMRKAGAKLPSMVWLGSSQPATGSPPWVGKLRSGPSNPVRPQPRSLHHVLMLARLRNLQRRRSAFRACRCLHLSGDADRLRKKDSRRSLWLDNIGARARGVAIPTRGLMLRQASHRTARPETRERKIAQPMRLPRGRAIKQPSRQPMIECGEPKSWLTGSAPVSVRLRPPSATNSCGFAHSP